MPDKAAGKEGEGVDAEFSKTVVRNLHYTLVT